MNDDKDDERLLNLHDYERAAQRLIERPDWAYIEGGAADGWSLVENRRAFERWLLRPRVLRGVGEIDTRTTVGGVPVEQPVLLAPTAQHQLAHPEGEVATAKGARAAGVVQILSTMANRSVEEVAATGVALWFQLYVFPDRQATERLVLRAEAAGARALVLTVDVPVLSLRENLERIGFAPTLPLPNLDADLLGLMDGIRGFDSTLTWKDVDWLVELTSLPVWIKGILRGDDARTAVEHGAAGVIVSNHGARQLDGTIAPVDALPEVVQAVGHDVEVLVDGGIRRGTDVIKCLALGARAVLLGRSQVHGLAVDGAAGVEGVLSLMRAELENGMAQCGARNVNELSRDLVMQTKLDLR